MDNPYEPPSYECVADDRQSSQSARRLIGFLSVILFLLVGLSALLARAHLVLPAIFIAIVCGVIFFELYKEAKFRAKYPRIDDEEFIRRCRPGVNREIALRVRQIISDSTGTDYERVYPEQAIVELTD